MFQIIHFFNISNISIVRYPVSFTISSLLSAATGATQLYGGRYASPLACDTIFT